jgi:high affinity Mn2+ porin
LSTGLGVAGAPNLDIVRNPLLSKAPYLGRGMIHKVFALSQDKVENDRSYLSLFDELPRRRLEIRAGKFSKPDFFDLNSAGSDTHLQFVNWSVDNNGAWDYAADTRGYTVGVVADYEDRNWGFRFAEALMPKVANGIDLVWRPWQVHAENWEYELHRGLIPKRPGVVRLLAYTNSANMGIYRDAIAQFVEAQVTAPDITNHPWHITRKYGFGANLEENLTPNVTAFARWGWDNGKTESFAYTEIDSTAEEGVGVSGAKWRRKQDRAGVVFVSNGIKHKKGSPDLSRRRRLRFSDWRWKAALRAGKYSGNVLHGAPVAGGFMWLRGRSTLSIRDTTETAGRWWWGGTGPPGS